MEFFESNIRLLDRLPVLLIDNGSALVAHYLDEVRSRMKTATIDMAAMNINEIFDEVLAVEKDLLFIFLVPNKITTIEIGKLFFSMLKCEVNYYGKRTMDFDNMRYLVVAKGKCIDDLDSEFTPNSLGVCVYIPKVFKNLHFQSDLAIAMDEARRIKAYQLSDCGWEEDFGCTKEKLRELASRVGLKFDPQWDRHTFYRNLLCALEQSEHK